MFWIQALMEIKVINVVSTLFMLSRGLTLSQIFITSVVFSVVTILSELPSSYLADKWSRKGLIIISILAGIIYWTTNMYVYGFVPFLVVIAIFSISYSFMSGTDEALIYDSAREIGESKDSLKMFGKFHAASRIFKIIAPLVAVLIASNLTDFQFRLILGIDLVANLIALSLAKLLTEPKHFQGEEKVDKGILKDAIRLFQDNPKLFQITANRTFLFLPSFILWRVSSAYLRGLGASLLLIGLMTSISQSSIFVLNIKSSSLFKKWNSELVIHGLNIVCILLIGLFLVNELLWKNWVIALITFTLIAISEVVRWPFFSDLINKYSRSYNRATTISSSNLLTELLKLPILVLCSWLVNAGYGYLFGITLALAISTETLFSLDKR